ncbi:MAG: MBL fold metallo-hydrolase [Phycisphaerales bacterium]|nr:MBL fold metallo-hydrolase [Phycisphaerales bacterium]
MICLEVLASGSRGNAALVQLGDADGLILIDAGLSPRRTKQAIESRGYTINDVKHVLLTHDDSDHLHRGWIRAIRMWNFTLHVHATHLDDVRRSGVESRWIEVMTPQFQLSTTTSVEPHIVPHDLSGTAAFVIEHKGVRLGWATDLGTVGPSLIEHFSDLDALAIESNYDRQMQLDSNRPSFLIDRIMGGRGHLSNTQAIEAVDQIAIQSMLQHVVLLHLSRDCNCPLVVRERWNNIESAWARQVHIASQDEPLTPIRINSRHQTACLP